MSNTMSSRPERGRRDDEGRADEVADSGDGERQEDAGSEGPSELSESEVFDILRNSRRRAVIAFLRQHGGEASLTEVTEHVAAAEYEVDAEAVSSDQHKCVYTGLYQCHLPRLEKSGVIDFDKDDKSVALADNASRVESYLYRDGASEAVRLEFAGATAIALFTVLGVVGVGPLGAVPVTGWATITALALFGFAFFHLYR